MTRILVQRGSTGSSSNPNRSSSSSGSSSSSRSETQVSNDSPQVVSVVKKEEASEEMHEQTTVGELVECSDSKIEKSLNVLMGSNEVLNDDKASDEDDGGFQDSGRPIVSEKISVQVEGLASDPSQCGVGSTCPLPPSISLPKPSSAVNLDTRRSLSGSSNNARAGALRRGIGSRPIVSTRSSPTGSRPSSPRSYGESEGYNSADEQNPCFGSSYYDMERERQFEIDIRRAKNLEVRRMSEDGNCLFRAVADQVYGDSEAYDLTRQMCMDYMEQERDHFSQFITEGFTSYCKRKRRDQVYGNNVEIQALAEMYNRPIHIYSYSTEPINTFHGNYNTDTPPIRLSYHHGNHYNSLVDPRRLTVGAGLGFSSLQGRNVDKEQVKAAIKAQQDQQIDNALVAEGQFYSDLEITEKEIEQMVMEASRAEYLAKDKYKPQLGIALKDSSTSAAEPSSSGARASGSATSGRDQRESRDPVLSSSVQMILSMGFSYLQAIEAFSIFGDDVDSMVCYLLETGSSSRRKGKKATE